MQIKLDLSSIQPSDTIIVANNRQALAFKSTIISQIGAVKMPKFYSYPNFIKKTWTQLNPQSKERLISDLELQALFREIISKNNTSNTKMLADEAIKCYRLMKTYFIENEVIVNHQSSIGLLFIDWLNKLKKIKTQSQIIDSTDIFSIILPALKKLSQSGNYYHYGIKKTNPEQQKMFELLQSRELKTANFDNTIKAISYETIEDELQNIAEWSKKINLAKPDEQIAIVIPNLAELKHKVCLIFDEVLQSQGYETQNKPYNISLGNSLLESPLIRHIFKIINLSREINKGFVELDTLRQIIQSPYISGAKVEANNRALLINSLLNTSKNSFSVKRLLALMSHCPLLLEQINSINHIPTPRSASGEEWLEILYKYLNAFSFGADRTLSSSEYQLFEKFQNESLILNQIYTKGKKVSLDKCLEQLKNHFDSVIFQPQASNSNIHILGALEAEGLEFDTAWVTGMTSDFLPGSVKFPLFIPSGICVEFNLPYSSFNYIQQDAIINLCELKKLGSSVIFSYAKTNNGLEKIATPLLEFEASDSTQIKPQKQIIQNLDDAHAPKIAITAIKQGVQTLQDQMNCPFKGFVKRLKIPNFKPAHLGFDKAEQGVLIHKTLETLFSEILSLTELKLLSDEMLKELIERHASKAIGKITKNFKALEKERIILVIYQYLNLEKQRSDFNVLATESVVDVCIKGLQFNTKIDRIDLLPNGDKLIIDYKTGKSELKQITGDVIEQAQLPIYAISNKVDGVAFAKINASECAFKAITKNRECLPNEKRVISRMPDWDKQIIDWEKQINKASIDFQQGVADVLPEKNACDYCDYDLLCRVEKTLGHS